MTSVITVDDGGNGTTQTGGSDVTTVTVETGDGQTVEIQLGVIGPQGPPGPASTPVHFALTNASSFTAQHSFDWYPNVWFIDAAGQPIIFGVEYLDSTHVHVQFPTPFTGTMYLR